MPANVQMRQAELVTSKWFLWQRPPFPLGPLFAQPIGWEKSAQGPVVIGCGEREAGDAASFSFLG